VVRNVGGFTVGRGSLDRLPAFVDARRKAVGGTPHVLFLVDSFFAGNQTIIERFGAQADDIIRFVDATNEPTTDGIDAITNEIRGRLRDTPATVVGFGGGTTMDTAKAVSNLLTNGGRAADYQDFYTGMDAYIHCIEALGGSYRNAVGDAYSRETVNLCRQVFHADDMMSVEAREQLMVASYLGGCAIATSYVGVVHPFSAGLSVVLGLHHCIANCIALNALDEFYPNEHAEFNAMMKKQSVTLPTGVCANLSHEQYQRLVESTVVHAKPLTNALGPDFRSILTDERVIDIFKKM
jgi:alcohol dehydrogenase class IV